MRREPIMSARQGDRVVEVHISECHDDPREWDNLGTMVCFHRRYDMLGDRHDYDSGDYESMDDVKQAIESREDVHTILPLYLYDHSGLTMNTTGFHCPWDSGQVGWIFVTKEKVKEEGIDDKRVAQILTSEVETYDKYLRGDVYEYVVYDVKTCDLGCEHHEIVESLCGLYDEPEEVLKEAMMENGMDVELVEQ